MKKSCSEQAQASRGVDGFAACYQSIGSNYQLPGYSMAELEASAHDLCLAALASVQSALALVKAAQTEQQQARLARLADRLAEPENDSSPAAKQHRWTAPLLNGPAQKVCRMSY